MIEFIAIILYTFSANGIQKTILLVIINQFCPPSKTIKL